MSVCACLRLSVCHKTFDHHIQQQQQEEMDANDNIQEVGGAAKVPQALPPRTQQPEKQRKKSDAASDSERSRSPHKDRRPPCAHRCVACASSFPSADLFTTRLKTEHIDEAKIISQAWMGLKATDPDSYATLRLTATCDVCLGVFPHYLPDR